MPSRDDKPTTYRDAGVDTGAGARAVESIRGAVRATYRPEVIGDIGGFGGLFSAAAFKDMEDPVLVSATDGVGTKLAIAQLLGRYATVGIDLVAMCANDVLVTGAEPLYFLDYVAVGKLDPSRMETVVSGIAEGCLQAGCALIGGEMAEHPGTMRRDDLDLAGFCVGVVDRPHLITGERIESGDVILGLGSSGVHSNGFSLVRKVLVDGHEDELDLPRVDLGGAPLSDVLLKPTRIYVKPVLAAIRDGADIKGMAHITGGGITENLNRCIPSTADAVVHPDAWTPPRVFGIIARAARLDDAEMLRTFNMGIGLCIIANARHAPDIAARLRQEGETVFEIGEIVAGKGLVRYA